MPTGRLTSLNKTKTERLRAIHPMHRYKCTYIVLDDIYIYIYIYITQCNLIDPFIALTLQNMQ